MGAFKGHSIGNDGSEMNEIEFWKLIEECKPLSESELFGDEHLRVYTERLRSLTEEQLIAFARMRQRMMARSYDWKLWYATCALNRFCSDDSFTNFRAALIMLGKTTFERSICNPDSVFCELSYAAQLEKFERFDYVDSELYEELSSEERSLYDLISDLRAEEPTGTRLEFDSPDDYYHFLRSSYPEICRKFGNCKELDVI